MVCLFCLLARDCPSRRLTICIVAKCCCSKGARGKMGFDEVERSSINSTAQLFSDTNLQVSDLGPMEHEGPRA